jgi:hypothetical protein
MPKSRLITAVFDKFDGGSKGTMIPSQGIFDPSGVTSDLVEGLKERGIKGIVVIASHGNQRDRAAALREAGVTVCTPSQIVRGFPAGTAAVVVELMHASEISKASPAIKAFPGIKLICEPFGKQDMKVWENGTDADRARILAAQVFGSGAPVRLGAENRAEHRAGF